MAVKDRWAFVITVFYRRKAKGFPLSCTKSRHFNCSHVEAVTQPIAMQSTPFPVNSAFCLREDWG